MALRPGASGRKIDIVQPSEPIQPKALPPVKVSNVKLGDQDSRFTVDQIGVPVLVKISYFPNWKVSGAEGPVSHRAEPDGRHPDVDRRAPHLRAIQLSTTSPTC